MKKLIAYSLLFLTVLGLYSCLDDKSGFSDLALGANTKTTVSFFGAESNRYSVAIPIAPAQELPVKVAIGGGAKSDLSITFTMDGQAAVDAYNTQLIKEGKAHGDTLANGAIDPAKFTPFILLPANLYTIPNLTISVAKGKVEGVLPIVFNSSGMSLAAKYCLPLTIASVSGDANAVIADNFKQNLMYVQLKNKYDGIYAMTGTMVDYLNANLIGYPPPPPYAKAGTTWRTALVTSGASQVILYDADGAFAARHLIYQISPAGVSFYGGFATRIDFDPATNNVTAVTNSMAPQTNTREGRLDPTGINHWDPATKVLKIKYFMDQPGGGVGLTPRSAFNEVYTYTGVR